MGGAPAWDLHGVVDPRVKLGVANGIHPSFEDVVLLKQN